MMSTWGSCSCAASWRRTQNGGTRTFISIMALAFDNGFHIAIVLSKNSKALIQQTAKRLRSEFRHFIDEGELDLFDVMEAPASFNAFELQSKLIFVAKKEANNLRRLKALFENGPAMAAKRVLIVDDEADNASIGYVRKEGLIEANKIAKQISDLRSAIGDTSFLQVTATPYPLYLQPPEIEVGNVFPFKPIRPSAPPETMLARGRGTRGFSHRDCSWPVRRRIRLGGKICTERSVHCWTERSSVTLPSALVPHDGVLLPFMPTTAWSDHGSPVDVTCPHR